MAGDDEHFLWAEKYRPKKIDEAILPKDLKSVFREYVERGEIPNLILSGSSGIGKTTVARAMVEEVGSDYMMINGSLRGNIDTLRNDIHTFASTVSLTGHGRKYVILDEADYLNAQSTQPALRNFMEEYASNCGFILTCNSPSRIIPPLHSRCSLIEFRVPATIRPKLAKEFFDRLKWILNGEGVAYDEKALVGVIHRHFPDWRKILNEVQKYSVSGTIDEGMLSSYASEPVKDLVGHLKKKDFKESRKWVVNNLDSNPDSFYRALYEELQGHLEESSVPNLVLIVADYQYKSAFVADQEVNAVACLVELMMNLEFK